MRDLILYADSHEKEILELKSKSKEALEKKYEWDYIVDSYIEVFKEVSS